MNDYKLGHTIRTRDGKGRITYQPDWSQSMPWASYRNGTAGRLYASVGAARQDIPDLETDEERTVRLAALGVIQDKD